MSPLLFLLFSCLRSSYAVEIDIGDRGATPDDKSLEVSINNTAVFNHTLWALKPGDTLLVPKGKTFWFIGGIYAANLTNITIQIDGIIRYIDNEKAWPRSSNGKVKECMYFEQIDGIKFTSSNGLHTMGLIDGNGKRWWGAIQYLRKKENRPRLLYMGNSRNIEIEYIFFKNSPYWNVYLNDVANVHIHHSNISAKREEFLDYHDLFDLTAFNTDGFDIAGQNVHIHDCDIWVDDDCIAVKEVNLGNKQATCSSNMLFENIRASGLGLTIGSIGASSQHSCVNNITFRNIYMKRTFKGIYMKSRPDHGTGQITNVLYENITMDRPTQVPIWIGPQQAIYHGACSLLWPTIPGQKCPVPPEITWANITLRDITINSPRQSPGVILGNGSNPMLNITFDNVVVNHPGKRPWGDKYYACDGVEDGISTGDTKPVPPCFNHQLSTVCRCGPYGQYSLCKFC